MFRNANPFDEVVSNATSESLTSENWDLILTICEKVNRSGDNAGRDCIGSIQKRLINKNANVVLYSLTLCESLAKNCGLKAQREISSRAFTSLLIKTLNEKSTHPAVRQRILELVQQWAFEFRADPSLGIMDETYQQLRSQSKFKFPSPQKPKKELKSEADKRKEEEELQLALALSLSASEHSAERKSTSSKVNHPDASPAPVKRVRALYDFEPTESGELGFQKDDIIVVLATSYQDWWKGELYGRQGIFPVNYVEEVKEGQDVMGGGEADDEAHVLNEAKNIDGLIQMLSTIDPRRDNFSDNEVLQDTYNNVLGIRPKLVELIKKHGEKKDEMLMLNEKLARARATYEKMMEQSIAKYSNPAYGQYSTQPSFPGTPAVNYARVDPNLYNAQGQGQNGYQFSNPAYQPTTSPQDPRTMQYSSAPAQGQFQALSQQQDPHYAPYQPQQQPHQQQQQPQQPMTFDQAYAQPGQAVPNQPISQPQQQAVPYSQPQQPLQQQQQQQPLQQQPLQQQQPVQQQYSQPLQQDGQALYAPQAPYGQQQPSGGYAPQQQLAPTGVPFQ